MLTVEVFTDGACRGNPGVGGWGAFLRYQNYEKLLYGAEKYTTNNRMELMAPIMALQSIRKPCKVIITTDSQYVRKGITEWLINWKKRGWKTASKQPVKNEDLWKELEKEASRHVTTWYWIKAHAGHPENEKADQLANQGIDEWISQQK